MANQWKTYQTDSGLKSD